jgi:hypothetical protein
MVPFITINLDKPRKLRFGMAATVEFEQLTGLKLRDLEDELSFDVASKILWIMLKQDDEDLTLKQTYVLVDEYSEGMLEVNAAIRKAITVAFSTGEKKQKNV